MTPREKTLGVFLCLKIVRGGEKIWKEGSQSILKRLILHKAKKSFKK